MRITISLILLTLNISTAIADIETYICYGKEETYKCVKYNGNNPDMYDYPVVYGKVTSSVHEFSDAGTRNPYAPPDSESGGVTSESGEKESTPVFIPYSPVFLFGYGK